MLPLSNPKPSFERTPMPKFMFVYRGGCDEMENASPDEMQKVMQLWMDWIQDGMKAGWLIDGGDGLKPEGATVHADLSVTDGPFTESKELVGGYSMVQAENLAAAVELAKTSPIIHHKGAVEVRELANVGQPEEA
ncbi:YCII-related protein [Rhodopirellula europaea SH398]|jgi:hypothetical protein|uniref:YCII-related protein n=3 Tax=Pirellulaceae TaxID=2691357 RepID=M5S0E5_9BACT|nr:YCII-related protein [Rhodopirellula europaea SH398]PHQ31622.1 hypothetical protein CEE69_30165 [Rhodopirellula bahusiensis]